MGVFLILYCELKYDSFFSFYTFYLRCEESNLQVAILLLYYKSSHSGLLLIMMNMVDLIFYFGYSLGLFSAPHVHN